MSKQLKDLKVGDRVWCGGDSSFCNSDIETITKILKRFDKNTGKRRDEICIGIRRYDSITGGALNPPYAYYIQIINVK